LQPQLISSPYDEAPCHLELTSKLSQHQAHATQAKFNHKGQFKSLRIPPKGTPKKKSKKNTKKYLKHKSKTQKKPLKP
jgi:hypothetical protein